MCEREKHIDRERKRKIETQSEREVEKGANVRERQTRRNRDPARQKTALYLSNWIERKTVGRKRERER